MSSCSYPNSADDLHLPSSLAQVSIDKIDEAVIKGDDKNLALLLKKEKLWSRVIFKSGTTPLHLAAAKGYSRCLIILCESANQIQLKVIINFQNNDGLSALHLASQYGHNQCSRELLLRGANSNLCNNYGDTSLHTACRYGHAGVARILISASCNVNTQNKNGDTPLHIACAMGRRKLTRIVMEAFPNVEIRNSQGDTPFDIVKRKNFTEIMTIFNAFKTKTRNERDVFNTKFEFSPYGCQNVLETRSIFLTNVEQLSNVKLNKGEEYYIDLAGNLKKGPKCVTNTCVCKQLLNK
uniref:ANK_REP_REGION domain-containing protein n=1 Tax=Glossina pallidipes TaxID=7398 RepID=A0A1A9Z595_GLOPL